MTAHAACIVAIQCSTSSTAQQYSTATQLIRFIYVGCRTALRAVRDKHVVVVDGNQMFNRPGPRLVDALEFLVRFQRGAGVAHEVMLLVMFGARRGCV